MKKLICLLLSLCLVLALAACGGEKTLDNSGNDAQQGSNDAAQQGGENAPADSAAEAGFVFTHNGTAITMNAPAVDIVAALGDPKNYTEETSCAFEGLDKTYYYGSFYMQTYPMNDVDYIYCLWFADDTVTTAEGIYIGAPEAQVKTAYGEDTFNGTNAYVVKKGDSKLTVIIEGGVVSQITYDAVLN